MPISTSPLGDIMGPDGRTYPIQKDARGVMYVDIPGKPRAYISDGKNPGTGGGLVHGRAQFNTKTGNWDTPISGSKLLTYGALGGLTAGVANAALAGGAAASSSGAAASALPTTIPADIVGATAGGGAGVAAGTSGIGATLLKYGLQYGLPAATTLITGKMQSNAEKEAAALQNQYLQRALDAALEEQRYQRGVTGEQTQYNRAGDTYGRLSDEEKLAYDRSQDIRGKNYGYQQYGNFVETLEPYRIAGVSATDRLSRLIGGPSIPSTGSYLNLAKTARDSVQAVPTVPNRPMWTYTGQPPMGTTAPTPETSTTMPVERSTTMPVGGRTGELIRVEAPDGEIRELPPEQAAAYIQIGARRIA